MPNVAAAGGRPAENGARRGRRAAAAPWPATPPPPRTVARLGLCGFLRDGVDSAGFCDLYYGLKEDYSGGDAAGERWRSEHAK